MKSRKVIKLLGITCVATVLAIGLVSCGKSDVKGLTGGTAATVNGVEIPEDKVTTFIENMRKHNNITDEDQWKLWLEQNNQTPTEIRKTVLDKYIDDELIKQAAEKNDVKVDQNEVNEIVETMKKHYKNDEEWKKALEEAGTTEDQYKESVEATLIQKGLKEKVVTKKEPSEKELLKTAKIYAKAHDGARKSEHILFDASNEDKAQEVLDQIKSGEISFEDAVKKYSKDEGSKVDGGNVGWDSSNQFVPQYQDALKKLKKGEISDLVKSDYGVHIIKCTDVFNAPKELKKLSDLPEDFQKQIKETELANMQAQEMKKWFDDFKAEAEITVNDMPEEVPYNVELDKKTAEADKEAESQESK